MIGIAAYQAMRAPTSRWRRQARVAMLEVLHRIGAGQPKLAVLALVDAAYPFGQRSHHPYKAWLAERKVLIEALGLGPNLTPPNHEDAEACEVAGDLVEMGRAKEAQELVKEQAPRRHNRACPACGAKVGEPCRDAGDIDITPELEANYGQMIGRRRAIDRIVPHAARLVVDSGPLFGAKP